MTLKIGSILSTVYGKTDSFKNTHTHKNSIQHIICIVHTVKIILLLHNLFFGKQKATFY